ncbi:hypothetical protein [Sphingomonas glacialis]|uniref:hypothetical protein n=1 Tax=Sphingomonas glacialis TaxID=658225 RepID=UPI0013869460|nr:hypothetical protein [Sphingomonas glacialis]
MRMCLGVFGLIPFASVALSHVLGDLAISAVVVLALAAGFLGLASSGNSRSSHTH